MSECEPHTIPPAILAAIDQDRAQLSHLVAIVHEHRKVCDVRELCPGGSVFLAVMHMPEPLAKRLLTIALAVAGNGEPLWHEH